MDKVKLLQQCSEYFKSNHGFHRVLVKIKDRYKALGKIGGTIKLNNLTLEEKEALTGFLKKNYYKDSVSIKVDKFQEALKDTPFEKLDLIEVLEEYFGENIVTKKAEIEKYERDKEKFFSEILDELRGTKAYEWLEFVLNGKENAYRIIAQRYNQDRVSLKADLIITSKGLNSLPFFYNKSERLALFASHISKNPHIFDDNSECGKLLLNGIVYLLDEKYPQNAEEKAELLYRVGLIKDEISNFTICSGLLAYKDGRIHGGWEGFYNTYEPLQVSLWNLSKVQRIVSPKKKVFVFENPAVFSEILHKTSREKPALVCTYGQVKLASLVLLDKLVKDGVYIYYSGDFDPEGLAIADKLKSRYDQSLILWRYNKGDYYKALSKKRIDDKRMKKLKGLKNKSLISIGKALEETGCAGYQEMIIDELIDDIKTI
ncbi:TIGR02679 family protein [Paramaledivibacter caminithermalis]|jgi:uncharacterized protein (TIGR02679 family)|uniref:TIGR02679 family protein n=1 Tax=Paramaledivibacter caminithermalis (strain DSM 15212 / CIP 107654 / DViRD3) TaxID=1121301 RepID=A0A1M6T7L7_PARC5|nr:TIGR02679 family protein [Paramaledivibacter caminithermalis]SHK52876.1 TIGR02679 family protein [Paramaledivibacter caminithermalis DSM 15212]